MWISTVRPAKPCCLGSLFTVTTLALLHVNKLNLECSSHCAYYDSLLIGAVGQPPVRHLVDEVINSGSKGAASTVKRGTQILLLLLQITRLPRASAH
jgi:hypothetical protein